MNENNLMEIRKNLLLKKRSINVYIVVTNILILVGSNFRNLNTLEFILVLFFILQLFFVLFDSIMNINNLKVSTFFTYSSVYNRKLEKKLFSKFEYAGKYGLSTYLIKLGSKSYNILSQFDNVTEADNKLSGFFKRYSLKLSQFVIYLIIGIIFIVLVSVILFDLFKSNYLIIFAYLILRYMVIFYFSIIFDYISFYHYYKRNNVLYLYIYSHIYRHNDKVIIPQILPGFNSMIKYLYDNISLKL